MSAMIGRNKMIAMVSLAAAIGIPVQDPARGLPAFIIAGVVIGVQRIISTRTVHNPGFEEMVMGKINPLVKDVRLELDNMNKSRISRERTVTEFRTRGIFHLGKVQRAYLEANGNFTIYKFEDEEREGLCILPDWDKDFLEEMNVQDDTFACGSCGNLEKSEKKPEENCGHCGHKQWFKAIKS